ncbi:sensor histidine kinase [Pseudoalteromonas piscicida]|uniref:sensor histidine kinase n=1 Tax=Pseudoalteromonas piscicida TaxID=43662 RepID=UPI001F5B6F6F|nr:ATP-binding protein [Pseudoalteromonas piscicida]
MNKPNFEQTLSIFCLAIWLLFTILSGAFLALLDASQLIYITYFVLVLSPFALLLYHAKQHLLQPFYHLSTTIEAIKNEEYGQRFYSADKSGILHSLQHETQQLCEQLQSFKSERDHQAILLFRLIEQLPSPIAIFDNNTALVHANEAFSNWTGKPWQSQRLLKAHKFSLEYANGHWHFNHPTLSENWQLRFSELTIAGMQAHLVILTDVQAVVSQAQRDAWQKMIRVLSHEIHNSLSPIKSLAQTLIEIPTTKENQADFEQALGVIVQRSNGLMSFVNRYASVAKQHQLNLNTTSIQNLLQPLVGLFDGQVNLAATADFVIQVDQSLLEQALVNLIKNALEASANGHNVDVNAYHNGKSAFIEVLDEGHGINNLDNLFVPFYTTKASGKGVGLILAKNIIEQHGGTLSLTNRKDKQGAIAHVQLPLAPIKT